jgi:hypothetical protein
VHIDFRPDPRLAPKAAVLTIFCMLLAVGCAPIRGYPDDPENTQVTLNRLQPYFDGTMDVEYFRAPESQRTPLRDAIVYSRIRAYDIAFSDFERKLYGDANEVTLGSDLIALALAGLTATTGSASTKAALGAATAGVIGAKAAIDKDLYYQKTVPALLAQMEAARLNALLPITNGLRLPDAGYPLHRAYIDLQIYKEAGSIPAAINAINKDAGNAKQDAQDAVYDRGPNDFIRLPDVEAVLAELKKLGTDQQFIAVARAMEPYLAGRPAAVRNTVKTIVGGSLLKANGPRAKQALIAWIHEEDMSPLNRQQWLTAIASAQ